MPPPSAGSKAGGIVKGGADGGDVNGGVDGVVEMDCETRDTFGGVELFCIPDRFLIKGFT